MKELEYSQKTGEDLVFMPCYPLIRSLERQAEALFRRALVPLYVYRLKTNAKVFGYVLGLTNSRTEVSSHMPEWPNSFPCIRDSASNMLASTRDE